MNSQTEHFLELTSAKEKAEKYHTAYKDCLGTLKSVSEHCGVLKGFIAQLPNPNKDNSLHWIENYKNTYTQIQEFLKSKNEA